MKKLLFILLLFSVSIAIAGEKSVQLNISGMTCNGCVSQVEKALNNVKGVSDVKVSLENKSASLTIKDSKNVTVASLIKVVSDAGFVASETSLSGKKTEMKSKESCDDGCCDENDGKKIDHKSKSKKDPKKS